MASFWNLLRRWNTTFNPPSPPKTDDALRFGILGAANIAPMALITPAKSHPEVIIQAVAARDQARATAYARKHGIPDVKPDYQAILDDPNIDCVYIPLPNGLHYEWAMKALNAGKHVLLEKPAVSNAQEARQLFNHPVLQQAGAPVILEAFHYRFQPSWQLFISLLDQKNIEHAVSSAYIPWFLFPADDIRFRYGLAGGAMMDLGTYCISTLRQAFGAEATECLEAEFKTMPAPEQSAEHSWKAKWQMPNGGVAESGGSLRAGLGQVGLPRIKVTHKQVKVDDASIEKSKEKYQRRQVELANFMMGALWHRIDIHDEFVIKDAATGETLKRWVEKTSRKAYTFQEAGFEGVGADWWPTYRHQLEQFVNRVKGRKTDQWVDGEDSIAQAAMIDITYEKGGLPLRASPE
ncbi:hypothetical protein EDB81DRAFT_675858 [Dactylonectria macrodidyma]|uniref:D-xylose 1-dehydrogenase (NADP(+), D-xylono-1,5-lactone-forming) n=1 Tax=Dactylonectria macrodidyma TaxID=307937 RepID=A0A9P9FVM1_9HYPO|nr:hypothetical protein EDB81DRAFT_675858 [Dactylonectria macrodidyma]